MYTNIRRCCFSCDFALQLHDLLLHISQCWLQVIRNHPISILMLQNSIPQGARRSERQTILLQLSPLRLCRTGFLGGSQTFARSASFPCRRSSCTWFGHDRTQKIIHLVCPVCNIQSDPGLDKPLPRACKLLYHLSDMRHGIISSALDGLRCKMSARKQK